MVLQTAKKSRFGDFLGRLICPCRIGGLWLECARILAPVLLIAPLSGHGRPMIFLNVNNSAPRKPNQNLYC
jgi:hypothetical protein